MPEGGIFVAPSPALANFPFALVSNILWLWEEAGPAGAVNPVWLLGWEGPEQPASE